MTPETRCGKLFEDGGEFVCSELGVWTGAGWSDDWYKGLVFKPCTGAARHKAKQLTGELGINCSVTYASENQL